MHNFATHSVSLKRVFIHFLILICSAAGSQLVWDYFKEVRYKTMFSAYYWVLCIICTQHGDDVTNATYAESGVVQGQAG